ncbi:MAG: aminotransferase class I/II-fold pyridoxal phosphate-dependent enzyme [Caldisericia bacterium]|nr:aminotransferase class I/II-fold pyridoxal phosphate-dependent enzyme [Caldisericia bacterium]
MAIRKLNNVLLKQIGELKKAGTLKKPELIICDVVRPKNDNGPRFKVEGYDQEFIKMNSNSYLGLSLRKDMIETEEAATKKYGVGPGAVRFISGSFDIHRKLEKELAKFHNMEEGMIFSSAYMTTLGVMVSLITPETIVVSDALNHNCIINAMKLGRPKAKYIYDHLDLEQLKDCLERAKGQCDRIIVVTDGIFSMRGEHAPLDKISEICEQYNEFFIEGVLLMVDDSHGVGSFGESGRGTIEFTNAKGVDVLVGTLGKAFGVNGGYTVTSKAIIEYLHQKAQTYIYSNPISPGEAATALKALQIITSEEGKVILSHLRAMTKRFKEGLVSLGYETLEGEHPVVPLMVRNTKETSEIVKFLEENGVLATGLNFPVVPKGDEEIRFQISGEHTKSDIDYVLSVLDEYKKL